jgi:hypothetical protein
MGQMMGQDFTCPFPVLTVRSVGCDACIGCACEAGTCIFLPSHGGVLFEPVVCASADVACLWRGVFGGTDCINSMVAFFDSWFFVGVLVSLVR